MTAIFDPVTGKRMPGTVLQLDRVQILGHKTADVHGYWAVQVGCGARQAKNVGRPMLGVYEKAGVAPKREVVEFKVKSERGMGVVGQSIGAGWWRVGDWVDVQNRTKGHGFTGGMKRWGWAGQPASHGNSLNHRTMGSSGGGQGSGSRVHPGKRMPGRMGNQLHTVQNLKVLHVDEENGIVVVSGPVPGPKKSTVRIKDAKKKPWPDVPSPLEMAMKTPPVVGGTTAEATA
jgi:large subunit ribosomal protein L3